SPRRRSSVRSSASSRSTTSRRPWRWPTTRTTGCRARCTPGTPPRPSGSPGASGPDRCRSTAGTCVWCSPSAATSSPAWDARATWRASAPTWRPSSSSAPDAVRSGPPPVRRGKETSMVEAREPVIVVGAGLSGLATALGAAVRGRDVIVFEAADLVGGAAAYSGGQVWIGANPVAEREGIEDSLGRTETYVRAIAHDDPEVLDEKAMLRWIHAGPEAVRYWEDLGAIRWKVIPGLADYHNEADGALPVGRYLTNEVLDGAV